MDKPSFREALKFWTKLGFISFGGPAGQIAIMHEYLVSRKKWISHSKFFHALNYCMILPGPEAQQLAIYSGWLLHGTKGGLAAGILFVLSSMFILLGLSVLYVSFGSSPISFALISGLKPAVIAIVILALIKIGKKSLLSSLHYWVALAAFVCLFLLHIPFPLIILSVLILADITSYYFPHYFAGSINKSKIIEAGEGAFYIIHPTQLADLGFRPLRFWKQIATGLFFWLIPFRLIYIFTYDSAYWHPLSLYFTRAALVTFGGAYAVLPYVAQVSVEKHHWLTNMQMIDGLVLGETMPGPLIMVLAFVGFMAGYHHFESSLMMGALGLVLTTFYTFLPCFLFIFIGTPIIENTQDNERIKEMLSLITAAVVDVVLNLTIYLGKVVLFPGCLTVAEIDYVSLGWMVISFLALDRYKTGMISWIVVSAIFGIAYYFATHYLSF